MRKYLSIAMLSLCVSSVSTAANKVEKLPKACEKLAWDFAKLQSDIEVYASIEVESKFKAVVKPNETMIYEITFVNWSTDEECLIEKIEAGYR